MADDHEVNGEAAPAPWARSALAGIENVPWGELQHAYGNADDVPELLRSLLSRSASRRQEALQDLFGTIWHQGTVYSSTAHAVPFLARIAAIPGLPDRHEVLGLLQCAATGTGYFQVHRRLINDVPKAELDERERQERVWVRAAREAVLREVGRFCNLL